jgi:hypothetical protein
LPAEALADFVGVFAAADLVAGRAAFLLLFLVVPAATLESPFFATGADFFDSVAA